jgi:hypothetical protein
MLDHQHRGAAGRAPFSSHQTAWASTHHQHIW